MPYSKIEKWLSGYLVRWRGGNKAEKRKRKKIVKKNKMKIMKRGKGNKGEKRGQEKKYRVSSSALP